MKTLIRRFLGVSEPVLPDGLFVSRELHQTLESIKPGAVEFISCKSTGSQFAILNRDDFEHIIGLANLKVESRADNGSESR